MNGTDPATSAGDAEYRAGRCHDERPAQVLRDVIAAARTTGAACGLDVARGHAAANGLWVSVAVPAQHSDAMPSGLIGPHGYGLASAPPTSNLPSSAPTSTAATRTSTSRCTRHGHGANAPARARCTNRAGSTTRAAPTTAPSE